MAWLQLGAGAGTQHAHRPGIRTSTLGSVGKLGNIRDDKRDHRPQSEPATSLASGTLPASSNATARFLPRWSPWPVQMSD
jgi:hypothetical protein